MAHELTTLDEVRELLQRARVIAVLGAHPEASRAASYVPAYLHSVGYRILPVNPRFAGTSLFGAVTRATLAELQEPVDIVDVFRPSDALPQHLEDMLAMRPLPGCVWLQQGIEHETVAAALVRAGVFVVQDRCTLADHRRLDVGPIPASFPQRD